MSPASHLYVVTPAWNEAPALRQLLPALDSALRQLNHPFTICVVDDGSHDETPAVLQQWAQTTSLHPLRLPVNQGYGASIRAGIDWVLTQAQADDMVLTLDSDNTHSPDYFSALVQKLKAGDAVVTASYTLAGGSSRGVSALRKLLSWTANRLLALRFCYPGITSYTNGFRAYRIQALLHARARFGEPLITENDFAGGTELFLKVLAAGARAGEIPFELRYDRRGESKIRFFRTIRGYLKLLQ